jgi:hypothetical protein
MKSLFGAYSSDAAVLGDRSNSKTYDFFPSNSTMSIKLPKQITPVPTNGGRKPKTV